MPFAVAAHRIALENPLVQFDPDTRDFIMRVERADGQALEASVRQALDAFVRGCKADGIWDAIKACCVMVGARTLAGALTPLKGVAPTNFNFVSGDYDRKTGLKGNGSTKYLDSQRNNNADPQNNYHTSVCATEPVGSGYFLGGNILVTGTAGLTSTAGALRLFAKGLQVDVAGAESATGTIGVSRASSADFVRRINGGSTTVTNASTGNTDGNIYIFARNSSAGSGAAGAHGSPRLSMYSIGESLDLALLDARVTALRNAIATSIDGVSDPDARAYINAVEAADGQTLEVATAQAIGNFIVGCKADGIWEAIKACCIMMGARTLAGALVPLKGTAPTNFNFVSGDYDRKTGLLGNGTTKYLNSNRNNNADPQNSKHLSVYASSRNSEGSVRAYIGAAFVSGSAFSSQLLTGASASKLSARVNDASTVTSTGNLHSAASLLGASRSGSANYTARGSDISETFTATSGAPTSNNIFVFCRNFDGVPGLYADGRISFYSVGEAINLALLDARLAALSNAISTAF